MHKKRVIKISAQLLLTASIVSMAGCGLFSGKDSYFRDYSVDYVKAKETKPLEVPAGLNTDTFKSVMPIPAASNKASGKDSHVLKPNVLKPNVLKPNVIPVPADAVMRAGNLSYRIAPTASGSVIESDGSREMLWIRIQAYLQQQKITVTEKDEKKGVLETAWFIPGGQAEHGIVYRSYVSLFGKTKDEKQQLKLRFSLKPSTQQGVWMVAIQAQQRPVGSTKSVVWNSAPDSMLLVGIKQDFLTYLVEHSGDQIAPNSHGTFNPGTMAAMTKDGNGNPILKISASFDTAWDVIDKALDKMHVTVKKANHAAGIFYIALPGAEHVKPEETESPGFFEKLFGHEHSKKTEQAPVYRLILAPVNDGVYASLEKNIDTVAPEKLSEVVLRKIKHEL